jgi:hypothetical protein
MLEAAFKQLIDDKENRTVYIFGENYLPMSKKLKKQLNPLGTFDKKQEQFIYNIGSPKLVREYKAFKTLESFSEFMSMFIPAASFILAPLLTPENFLGGHCGLDAPDVLASACATAAAAILMTKADGKISKIIMNKKQNIYKQCQRIMASRSK